MSEIFQFHNVAKSANMHHYTERFSTAILARARCQILPSDKCTYPTVQKSIRRPDLKLRTYTCLSTYPFSTSFGALSPNMRIWILVFLPDLDPGPGRKGALGPRIRKLKGGPRAPLFQGVWGLDASIYFVGRWEVGGGRLAACRLGHHTG